MRKPNKKDLAWDRNQEPIETVSCLSWPNLVSPYFFVAIFQELDFAGKPEKSALVNVLNGTSYSLSCKAMNMKKISGMFIIVQDETTKDNQ